MYSLRPHTKIDFVRLWKYGFRLSGVLIALALVGFVVSTVLTGAPLTLDIDENAVEIETIGASWGASVIWSSVLAFFLSCLGILAVIAIRYREPRMGVVALICLFHDMIVVLGIYAWAGLFFHMEITSDVIAALLAIIGYSLYDLSLIHI